MSSPDKANESQPSDVLTLPLNKAEMRLQVLQIFGKLNTEIATMDSKVEGIIDKHQGQFVLAYQNHVRSIQSELLSLKKRIDQQDKILKDNNRVNFLQKQTVMFREQALNLYEKLEAKNQEAQYYKFKTKDLEKSVLIMQKQIRECMKAKKFAEITSSNIEQQLVELREKLKQKDEQIKQLNQGIVKKNIDLNNQDLFLMTRHHKTDTNSISLNTSKLPQKSTKFSLEAKPLKMEFKRNYVSYIGLNRESELKEWFVECLRAVKKEVAARKRGPSNQGLQSIKDISQFKLLDKLSLLQKFMENERLLVWMYQKIFPSRVNEVREYLSNRNMVSEPTLESPENNESKQLSRSVIDSVNKSALDRSARLETSLPKMNTNETKKGQALTNRISFKQGKLKITNL